MRRESYQDMQLLHAVEENPSLTQRDLGKRIGAALGLTHLRLHRLGTKGFIQIVDDPKHRVRYVITPEGISEKDRLIAEYLDTALRSYAGLRSFLRERLIPLAYEGLKDLLLVGTGEVAEVAYLTILEEGLHLVAVVGDPKERSSFFHLPVRPFEEIPAFQFDRVVVATGGPRDSWTQRLRGLQVPREKIIQVPDDQALFPPQAVREPFLPEAILAAKRRRLAARPLSPAQTDVLVLCGGRGNRLGHLTDAIAKPLLPVGGQPFLLRLLRRLKAEGFRRFVLASHYLSDQFQSFLVDYRDQLPGMALVIEPEPLGTGGALRHAVETIRSSAFLVVNGDSWLTQPMPPVLKEHGLFNRDFTGVAVEAGQVEGEALQKGVWQLGPNRKVAGFTTQAHVAHGWVNGGCYVMRRSMVALWPKGSYSLEVNLPALLTGRRTGVYCSKGRLLDIGTLENYHRAEVLLASYASLEHA